MADTINDTPRSGRLHIGVYGRRNAGKSSLVNAITGHETAIVSETAGTTTDPVYKSMEIHGLGPCVLIDTAGFDDVGPMGELRVEKTRLALEKTDIALLVVADEGELSREKEWVAAFRAGKKPFLIVLNKSDKLDEEGLRARSAFVARELGSEPVAVSAAGRLYLDGLREAMLRMVPADWGRMEITGKLCGEGDIVMLIMPQDIQAPQGRLILPQVQVTRELLDKKCIVASCTADKIERTLEALSRPPHLIITDSQVFGEVWKLKPEESMLTSFSILMAGYKGDIEEFIKGAEAIDRLTPHSRVLIAEACTHAPLAEDIGREKIPRRLRARFGESLDITMVSGTDFPSDLTPYDLIIHCGACMFNRTYMMSRVKKAREQGVPMCNYGVALAKLTGILDKVEHA
ncbi:[FeFe] hydrogenase H-cluster maturation GTPase HydF [Mailhella massiliensis]|uniref:[FeFe] hydrogenase H-cluster maturation GTPase HydF n=1 Tax=Mailhella massiliensis TaxID=1903261 RepID=A0A921AXP4_9BACT|nr:[FeFe] hydrogenase H-cluster maturation GTPase HydF [Mailhella massiliensis]HJD98262.1 [FeFe] hydrogenase H-cluster maturation GTPase HydF [Mailhella massiliensis]